MHPVEDAAGAPVLVLSCSLNPASRSHALAVAAGEALGALGASCELLETIVRIGLNRSAVDGGSTRRH